MTITTPLADLIRVRMEELALTQQSLGAKLGYRNSVKAAGRVYALCNDRPFNAKSRAALRRLPAALGLTTEAVEQAVQATEQFFEERARQAAGQRLREQEEEDAAWRAAFMPHAVIQTERTVPSQISICGLTGGLKRWLLIPFDNAKPPITFIGQAVAGLHERYGRSAIGPVAIPFFGKALGLIINYTPDHAIRCELNGIPSAVLPKAWRLSEISLSIDRQPVSPSIAAKLLRVER